MRPLLFLALFALALWTVFGAHGDPAAAAITIPSEDLP